MDRERRNVIKIREFVYTLIILFITRVCIIFSSLIFFLSFVSDRTVAVKKGLDQGKRRCTYRKDDKKDKERKTKNQMSDLEKGIEKGKILS